MAKLVIDNLVLDYDTVAGLLESALDDDQAVYDQYGPTAGYLINVVARSVNLS